MAGGEKIELGGRYDRLRCWPISSPSSVRSRHWKSSKSRAIQHAEAMVTQVVSAIRHERATHMTLGHPLFTNCAP